MSNSTNQSAKASTAEEITSASTTPIVAGEPQATCFKAAKSPSKKKELYWAGFSVIKQVDGKEIDESLAGTSFQRESQAAFAWSKSSLAALEKKSFSAAALENHLGLDFGDY